MHVPVAGRENSSHLLVPGNAPDNRGKMPEWEAQGTSRLTFSRGCPGWMLPYKEFFMHLGGIIVLFLVSVFWLAKHPEWVPFVDFVFQFFLFCLLGKIVLVPTFWLGVVLKNWHIPLFGFSLMVSVFIRWMLVLVFDFKVANTFQIVETWYGIPYSLACAAVIHLVLWRLPFVRRILRAAQEK